MKSGIFVGVVLLSMALLVACATVHESYAPDGRKAYTLNCSGDGTNASRLPVISANRLAMTFWTDPTNRRPWPVSAGTGAASAGRARLQANAAWLLLVRQSDSHAPANRSSAQRCSPSCRSPTLPASRRNRHPSHVGDVETVCGVVASTHYAARSRSQ
jgi:hypothetical protein